MRFWKIGIRTPQPAAGGNFLGILGYFEGKNDAETRTPFNSGDFVGAEIRTPKPENLGLPKSAPPSNWPILGP